MITCNLKLDKRRVKNDGTYPLVFRIATKNTSRDISIGFSIPKNQWNNRTNGIKESYSQYDAINPIIKDQNIRLLNKLNDYQNLFPNNNDIQAVKEYLLGKDKSEFDVYTFWEEHIESLKFVNRIGGAQVYTEALIAINKVKSLKIQFQKVDFKFLNEVENIFLNRGVKPTHTSADKFLLNLIHHEKCIIISNDTFNDWQQKDFWVKKNIDNIRVPFMIKDDKVLFSGIEKHAPK